MSVQIKCPTCGATSWHRGYSPRPNEWTVRDDDPLEDACQHIRDTNDFIVVEVAD